MLIPCPWCGLRDASEFTYSGDAGVQRPDGADASLDEWCAYVYQRRNPMGAHQDYWHHTHGCRLLLRVDRNTATHKIEGAVVVGPWDQADVERKAVAS